MLMPSFFPELAASTALDTASILVFSLRKRDGVTCETGLTYHNYIQPT